MGKGGKANQQQLKGRQPESESGEQVEEEAEDDDDGDDEEEVDYFDAELSDRDEQLLERINTEIKEKDQPLKLTWAAIYKVKEEEKELNQKMDEEMRKIQAKFDHLRAPLIHKIAKVASGQPVEKQIYTHHQLTKQLNVNKYKPQAIPGFWRSTLQSVGFTQCQEDEKILDSCTKVECNTHKVEEGENQEQTIKVIFQFAENDVISNKELKIEIQKKGQDYTVKEKTPIQFKSLAPETSSFAEMFNPEIIPERLYTLCQDLQRAYNNSVFYYFYQGEDDSEQPAAIEGEKNQDDDQEQDEDEDEDEDSQEDIQPVKNKGHKKKGNQADNKPPIEKPQCKNQ